MNTTREPRIIVVGAGLGGLTCANVLQRHGRAVTVLEREAGADARTQGGSLDIHADTGQAALRAAGLLDGFRRLARPEGDQWRVLDHASGAVLADTVPAAAEQRPEIDRGQLRRLLLDALAPGTVRWGRGVTAVAPLDSDRAAGGAWRLSLADGTTLDADLVIGADGTWSRVRPVLSTAVPEYTGVTFVETGLDDCDERHPEAARLVGQGSMLAKGVGRSLIAQRNSDARIRVYAAFRAARDWPVTAGVDLDDRQAVRAHLLTIFEGWDDGLLDLIRRADGDFAHRPLFVLPAPHDWDHVPGVTLLGDAAHLMPPVGLGANLAMLDGAQLAEALVNASDLDAGVRAYEEVMLPRSASTALECVGALDHLVPVPSAAR